MAFDEIKAASRRRSVLSSVAGLKVTSLRRQMRGAFVLAMFFSRHQHTALSWAYHRLPAQKPAQALERFSRVSHQAERKVIGPQSPKRESSGSKDFEKMFQSLASPPMRKEKQPDDHDDEVLTSAHQEVFSSTQLLRQLNRNIAPVDEHVEERKEGRIESVNT